jgi:hypothetical protein
LGGNVHVRVHDTTIKLVLGLKLTDSGCQALVFLGLCLCSSAVEATHKFIPAGWEQEYEAGLGHRGLDLTSPLKINLEKDGFSCSESLGDRAPRGAVTSLAVNGSPLQELSRRNHPVKLRLGNEEIALTLDFSGARSPCRRRNGQMKIGIESANLRGDSALSYGGRAGENDDLRGLANVATGRIMIKPCLCMSALDNA